MTADDYFRSAGQKAKAHDPKGAIADLDKALEADPKHLKALINRGNLHKGVKP
jgi:hypothetical protein